ncbi:MAG: AAA family ATPase, partial [Gemmatimonadaceae bacterium]
KIVSQYLRWGAGPRAGQALILGAKASALLSGRAAVSPADIQRVALPVLRHRVLLNFAAEAEGVDAERIVEALMAAVPAPSSALSA